MGVAKPERITAGTINRNAQEPLLLGIEQCGNHNYHAENRNAKMPTYISP
jgi:hypothetical protein